MLMVVPNEGKEYWLNIAFGNLPFDKLDVQLYKNNYTPDDDSVRTDFTAADFTGAGIWTIDTSDWGVASVVSDVAEITATPPPEWTHGGGASQTVYGWYALFQTDSIVAFAQRFDTPRVMTPGSIESLDPFTIKMKTFA